MLRVGKSSTTLEKASDFGCLCDMAEAALKAGDLRVKLLITETATL